jgi:hypothetical protein
MKQIVSPNFNGCGLNEAADALWAGKQSRLPDPGLGFMETAIERRGALSNGGPSNLQVE